jgi:hypothetical protein
MADLGFFSSTSGFQGFATFVANGYWASFASSQNQTADNSTTHTMFTSGCLLHSISLSCKDVATLQITLTDTCGKTYTLPVSVAAFLPPAPMIIGNQGSISGNVGALMLPCSIDTAAAAATRPVGSKDILLEFRINGVRSGSNSVFSIDRVKWESAPAAPTSSTSLWLTIGGGVLMIALFGIGWWWVRSRRADNKS